MTYPPQEPGSWQDPTRPSESPGSASEQRPQSPSQPAADPYGTMPVPPPGYGSGYP
ncbi:MAG: hypothetical protein QOE03_2667, partial [Micromonosporaceae bacterium]|nr:hypothetical protein [Micromonosporaceae bacterium]